MDAFQSVSLFFAGLGVFFIGIGVLWFVSLYKGEQRQRAGRAGGQKPQR